MPDQSLLSTVRSDLADERDRLEAQIASLEPGGGERRFDDNFADSGQVAAEQGENKVLASQLRSELDEVERALAKLDDGTYGKCETCGEPIAAAAPRGHAGRPVLHRTTRRSSGGRRTSHLVKRFFGSLRPGGPPDGRRGLGRRATCCPASSRCGAGCRAPTGATPSASPSGSSGRSATRPPARSSRPRCCTTSARSSPACGTYGRVVATLSAKVAGAGHGRHVAASSGASPAGSASTSSTTRLGGDLLELAGSDPLTVAWAREHHRPESEWTVDADVGGALKAADDD